MSNPDTISDQHAGHDARGAEASLVGIVAGVVEGFSSMAVAAGGVPIIGGYTML